MDAVGHGLSSSNSFYRQYHGLLCRNLVVVYRNCALEQLKDLTKKKKGPLHNAIVRYTRFMVPQLMRDQDYQYVQTSGGACNLTGFILSFCLRDKVGYMRQRQCCLDKYGGLNGEVRYSTTCSIIVRCAVSRQAIDISVLLKLEYSLLGGRRHHTSSRLAGRTHALGDISISLALLPMPSL